MKKSETGALIFSPSDLITYLKSPFASWMDRYNLENPGLLTPDQESEEDRLIAQTGDEHEQNVLNKLRAIEPELVEIPKSPLELAKEKTKQAFASKAKIVYQAYLQQDNFAGHSDFVQLEENGRYQVWDTKLARSPKPYYAVQLCCYSEMLAATLCEELPKKFGIILGDERREEFRVEDFVHYYRQIKASFLELQNNFTGDFEDRPEPLPRAENGRWTSYAKGYFLETDHLVQVANISVGQIKKLRKAGIHTVSELAQAEGTHVPKLNSNSLQKLSHQARLQLETRKLREADPEAKPVYEPLPLTGPNGEPVGLATLPPAHPADVFFDMEGFPLAPGGLEYLWGACTREIVHSNGREVYEFKDWWAHNRAEEKTALEGFVDWVYARWQANPGMHIYHYAAYEVSAVRRLSTRHDTRQQQVDDLLRNNVFVDLFQVVRRGLRVGEENYSIKSIERLYSAKRTGEVSTSLGSVVQYARWMESGEGKDWDSSAILKAIRDYNEDDCVSTVHLEGWLRNVATEQGAFEIPKPPVKEETPEPEQKGEEPSPSELRKSLVDQLRQRGEEQKDEIALALADLLDFHYREEKPLYWKKFDRIQAEPEVLRDDSECIEGIQAVGSPVVESRSLVQTYRFDPTQECKRHAGDRVMFTHASSVKLNLTSLDFEEGTLTLKLGANSVKEKFGGQFPAQGSLIPDEIVPARAMQDSLMRVATAYLEGQTPANVRALLTRQAPADPIRKPNETTIAAATRVAEGMKGGCFVVQGPPGTGKTFTASRVIATLLAQGKRVGITSNSKKAIINLLAACGEALKGANRQLTGVMVGCDEDEKVFEDNPGLVYVSDNSKGFEVFQKKAGGVGVAGGTAWMFSRPEWSENGQPKLDYLFIDEASQVSLANAVAMAPSATNLVLLGDQMQLEQVVQGSHPGDAGLSALHYALKDPAASKPDVPVLHAVIPDSFGLFLGQSFRMHPEVCRFISESIYEGRLASDPACANQKITLDPAVNKLVTQPAGILFSPVEHDGNALSSEEEVQRVVALFNELLGRPYTAKDGQTRPLALDDFLFVAPYNVQVRALKRALPEGARVGSVDKFQGQEAPVCILSLGSSYGEYGSRGLTFILDRNRMNVAISRAQCLAIVVADPRIAGSAVNSVKEMRLINLFCKFA